MENADARDIWWQEYTTGQSERWLIEAAVFAEPLLYLAAMLVFLAGSLLLVWKTRAPGRFLILSSVLAVAATIPLGWHSTSNMLTPGVASFAAAKLALALAALLGALGFGRIAWHLFKSRHAAEEAIATRR
jgi:hypothetical protein